MNRLLPVFAAGLICITVFPSAAQGLKDAKPTLKAGNWTVLRSIDTMTDKISCTGIYKANYGIQLSRDKLFIKFAGGIQSVTLRFGEDPPQSLRLPQDMEKKLNSVIIEGNEFRQATETARLRIQVLTLIRGVATEDLDTTGIQTAAEHIQAGCPQEVEGAAGAKPTGVGDSSCPEALVARLRAAGVTVQQIATACRQ
jgi:hypothetical protein